MSEIMSNIGIFFGSSTGNTEKAAEIIKKHLGGADLINVGSGPLSNMSNYDIVIFGCSTWGMGDLQDDWEPLINELSKINLAGKKVAFFGTGDQISYPDTFVDALGILYDEIKNQQIKVIGTWPTDGYDFTESRALINDSFIGLPLDDDNEPNLTDKRISDWVAQLKSEL